MIIATRQPQCGRQGRYVRLLLLKNHHILRGGSFPFQLLLSRFEARLITAIDYGKLSCDYGKLS